MIDNRCSAFVVTEVGIGRTEDLYLIQKLREVLLISLKEGHRDLITLLYSEDRLELIVLSGGRGFEEVGDEAEVFLGHSLTLEIII